MSRKKNSTDLNATESPASNGNGQKRPKKPNDGWYACLAIKADDTTETVIKYEGTKGRIRKWAKSNEVLLCASFASWRLVRCKPVSLEDATFTVPAEVPS